MMNSVKDSISVSIESEEGMSSVLAVRFVKRGQSALFKIHLGVVLNVGECGES